MKGLHMVAYILLVIGGLNWGLEYFGVGLASWGLPSGLVSLIYLLVGIAAIVEVVTHKNSCKHCETKMSSPMV